MNPSQNLGKSTEMMIASILLAENREVYLPAVDDHGVDMIVRTRDFNNDSDKNVPSHYEFQEIQVKSLNEGGLFAAFNLKPRPDYWFVFYVKQHNTIWLINSEILSRIASQNSSTCKNAGKWSVSLATKNGISPSKAQYVVTDFSKLP